MTEGITHDVLLLSQHCIEYRTSARSEKVEKVARFEVTEESKSVSLFSRRAWVLQKIQLYRMSSSNVLRAIR